MDLYTLKFAADDIGEAKNVVFEAANHKQALMIAGEEAKGRAARLYAGRKQLWSIDRPLIATPRQGAPGGA